MEYLQYLLKRFSGEQFPPPGSEGPELFDGLWHYVHQLHRLFFAEAALCLQLLSELLGAVRWGLRKLGRVVEGSFLNLVRLLQVDFLQDLVCLGYGEQLLVSLLRHQLPSMRTMCSFLAISVLTLSRADIIATLVGRGYVSGDSMEATD